MSVDAISQRESWADLKANFAAKHKAKTTDATATDKTKTDSKTETDKKTEATATAKKSAVTNPMVEEMKAKRKYMSAIHGTGATSTTKKAAVDILA